MRKLGALVTASVTAAALYPSEATPAAYQLIGGYFNILITTSDTLNARGGYDILDITGTLNTPWYNYGAVTGPLYNPYQPIQNVINSYDQSQDEWYTTVYDNTWYDGTLPRGYLDHFGLSFSVETPQGELYGSIWSFGATCACAAGEYGSSTGYGFGEGFTPSYIGPYIAPPPVVVGAPEPAAWAMMLIGFAGMGLLAAQRAAVG